MRDGDVRSTASSAKLIMSKQSTKASIEPLIIKKWPWIMLGVLSLFWHMTWSSYHFSGTQLHNSSAELLDMTSYMPSKDSSQHLCRDILVPASTSCPKYLTIKYLESAGIGHQFSEMLFALYASKILGLRFTWSPIVSSTDHGDNYDVLMHDLGLEKMFIQALGVIHSSDLPREVHNASNESRTSVNFKWVHAGSGPEQDKRKLASRLPCHSVLTLDAWYHCHGVPVNNCFWAPEHEFLFQRYAACFRSGVREYGTIFDKCALVPPRAGESPSRDTIHKDWDTASALPHRTVVVVWHIRLGDVAPHALEDPFYGRVIYAVKEVTRGYDVRILLVGGGSGRSVSQDHVDALRNVSRTHGLQGSVEVFWSKDFGAQFLAMMQSDMLIGSGSSVPQIASLLSGRPIFFNHEPKHGYGFGMEATWDTVDMAANGTVLDSIRRIRLMLFAKMGSLRDSDSDPCRSAPAVKPSF